MNLFARGLAGLLILSAVISMSVDGRAAEVLERWRQHDERSGMRIDHGAWEDFLLHYVRPGADGVFRVAYGEVKERDQKALSRYVETMRGIDIAAYRRSEQLAYWINLYNALLIRLVLDHYPIASIRKLERSSDGAVANAWQRPLVIIDDVSLSLDDIETRILQPIWHDPRIYYALTCAAESCPNLQPMAFTGEQLDEQLSAAAMDYVNDPRCIEIENGELHVSSFYRWHLDGFGGSERAIIQHLMAYAEPDLAMSLQSFDRLQGDYFDWRLNDATQ